MENIYLQEQENSPPNLYTSKDFSRLGWALSAMVVLTMVGGLLLVLGINLLAPQLMETGWGLWIVSSAPVYLLAFPVFCLILHKIPSVQSTVETSFSFGQFIKLLIISFGAMYIFNFLSLAINGLLGAFKGSDIVNPLETVVTGAGMIPTVVFAVLLAPVMEEIIFRGILVKKFRKWGEGTCIFLSAFSFALFHGNLSQMFYAFAIGAVLAYTAVKSGTILYAIIIHTIINFFGSVLMPQLALSAIESLVLFSGIFVIVMIIASIVLFFSNIRHVVLDRGEMPLTKGQKCQKMLVNPGMIVYVILCLLLVLLTIFQ